MSAFRPLVFVSTVLIAVNSSAAVEYVSLNENAPVDALYPRSPVAEKNPLTSP